MEETPTMKTQFSDFMKKITKPKLLSTLKPIPFNVLRGDSEYIIEVYPFFTVSDLKLAIYEYFEKESFAAPNNQLIYIDKGVGIETIDFRWNILLKNPQQDLINNNFVNPDGSKKNVKITLNDNILLENKLETNTINLLFYKDIEKYITNVKPYSEKIFNGRIYPYFPYLKNDVSYPNEADLQILNLKVEYYNNKLKYINTIEKLLSNSGTPLIQPAFAGLRFLKLTWPYCPIEENIDSYFYEIDVNQTRPYLRLLSSGNTAISKVHLKDIENKIPSIHDINLLSQWSEEKNPLQGSDFIIGKIALRCTILNLPFIYATIRLCHDRSFDVIIEPPKGIRKLNMDSDFGDTFEEDIVNGLDKINIKEINPSISSGNFTFGIQLDTRSPTITKKQFEKRISLFKPFFQEISALPNEQPFYMLRYKLVNNFTTEDNISNYLTQLANKKIVSGDEMVSVMITYVAEEFQLDLNTARQKVSDWFTKRDEIQKIVIGETKEYIPFNNTGIDISIFQTKNLYTIHLYNVDSFISLERIITSLSLVLSLSEEELKVSQKSVKEFEALEKISRNDDKESVAESTVESAENSGILDEFDDDLMQDFSESADTEESASHANVQDIREKIKEDSKLAQEDLKNIPLIQEKKIKVATSEDTSKGIANFFIQKLKEVDKSLFDFPVSHPSDLGYVQACAANEMRQPAALTRQQFDDMLEIYKDDDVDFRVYPPNEGEKFEEPDKFSDPNKIITILRYRNNYYVCSEYFCTRDEIVVLKKDFIGTKLRTTITEPDGTEIDTKPPNTCPFCLGKLITNRKKPGENETVLQRAYKPKTIKRHVWINFLKKSSHPSGWQLPCCFVSPSSIQFKDLGTGEFEKYKPRTEEDNDDEYESIVEPGKENTFPYTITLSRIRKKYIVGDVIPLDIAENNEPQIGLLPKQLDELLEQDPSTIVGRFGNLQKILPNAKGFLRVGVQNKKRFQGDSFLAAIAPFFGRNSASEMKARILEVILPRVFVSMNYGNLMMEFYNPTIKSVPKQIIEKFARDRLNVIYSDKNSLEIERIYKSYNSFINWLRSENTTKEYRQFGMILSQSSLIQQGFSRAGITFIIIDMNEDGSVSIRCPPYGYNEDIQTNNDVGFLFHHYSGIWEPLFYVNNIETGLTNIEPYQLLFSKASYEAWPSIVKKLWKQYSKICSGPGRTIYTSQTRVNSESLISLSTAQTLLRQIGQGFPNFSISGILRDSFNHVSAIVCEEKRADKNYQVLLPVIDDGVFIQEELYLNYEEIEPESFENTIRIYSRYLKPIISGYPNYIPVAVAMNNNQYVAIVLKNGLYIPIIPSTTIKSDLKVVPVKDFDWVINRKIAFEDKKVDIKSSEIYKIEQEVLVEKDINEIYEHLRITFGNYIAKYGSPFMDRLQNDIIDRDDLSLNDKRMRMILLLGKTVLSWFSTQESEKSMLSVLRKDCILQGQTTCNDKCVWSEDSGCKIHIKEKYKNVNMAYLLMLRLFDEILRYSEKRREIFENEITKLVFLNQPIYLNDQYILPENSLEWSELLRSTSMIRKSEASRFFEEFSSSELVEKEESDEIFELPDLIKEALELDKTTSFRFKVISNESKLTPILNTLGVDPRDIFGYNDVPEVLDIIQIMKLSKLTSTYIIQINTKVSPIAIKRTSSIDNKKPIIILLITEGAIGFIVKNNKSLKLNYSDIPPSILPQ